MTKAQSLPTSTIVFLVLGLLIFLFFISIVFNIGGIRDILFNITASDSNPDFLFQQRCFSACQMARGMQYDDFPLSDFCTSQNEGDRCYNDAALADADEIIYICSTTNSVGSPVELDEQCCTCTPGANCDVSCEVT